MTNTLYILHTVMWGLKISYVARLFNVESCYMLKLANFSGKKIVSVDAAICVAVTILCRIYLNWKFESWNCLKTYPISHLLYVRLMMYNSLPPQPASAPPPWSTLSAPPPAPGPVRRCTWWSRTSVRCVSVAVSAPPEPSYRTDSASRPRSACVSSTRNSTSTERPSNSAAIYGRSWGTSSGIELPCRMYYREKLIYLLMILVSWL